MRLKQEQVNFLEHISEVFSRENITWFMWGGFAAVQYGSKRELTDFDIFVKKQDFKKAFNACKDMQPTKLGVKEVHGFKGISFSITKPGCIGDFITDHEIIIKGEKYSFEMDNEMMSRIKKKEIHHLFLPVIPPEDLIAWKAIMQRGKELGKYDLRDVEFILKKQRIDWNYLKRRAEKCNASERVFSVIPR